MVVIFSNSVAPDSPTGKSSPWLKELTNKMLDGNFDDPDIKSAYNKTVDEATALATELRIPLKELPCVLIFDNSNSKKVYRIPYSDEEVLGKNLASIVDFIQKKYPTYCENLEKLIEVNKKIDKFQLGGIPKRIIKMASNHPDIARSFYQLENEVRETNPENKRGSLLSRLNHIRFQPNDITVFEATTKEFTEAGINPETISRLRTALFEVAIKETKTSNLYFTTSSSDYLEKILLESRKLRETLEKCDHPDLQGWVQTQKIVNIFTQTVKTIPTANNIFDIVKKISSVF